MLSLRRRLDRLEAAVVDERPLSDEARASALADLVSRGLLTVDTAGVFHTGQPDGDLIGIAELLNVLKRGPVLQSLQNGDLIGIAELLNIARKRAGL